MEENGSDRLSFYEKSTLTGLCYEKLEILDLCGLGLYLDTYILVPRVPQCLSPRQNWDPPIPLLQASVYPYETKGGVKHSPAGEGVGASQCGRLEKKPSTLSTLWYYTYLTWEVCEWYRLTWRWWQGTVPPLCKLYQNFSTLLTIPKLS